MAMIRQPENFPETVKEVRRQLALSQEELAQALGVSFATVNRWENGKTRQRVMGTVGRLDQLRESGELEALLESVSGG